MKRIFLILLFISSLGFSQSSGITYQAVIYNPNGEELPGIDNPYAPLTNQDVCLQFGIVDADGNVEYQEQVQVTTDAFGMVNLLIGTNTQTGGYAADFAGIEWSADAKFLKVDLDIKGNCTDFEELSNQPFTYVPFAYYSPASDTPGPEGPQGPAGQDGNDGQDGATGPAGPAGSTGQAGPAGASGQDGATGPSGPSGPQGEQGPAGANGEVAIKTLINTSDEAVGDNCANGGVKIEVGEDINADGVLDTDEVDDSLTRYVCNGADGEDGSDGQDGGGSSALGNGNIFTSGKLFNSPDFTLSSDGSTIVILDGGSSFGGTDIYTYRIENNQMTSLGGPFVTSNVASKLFLNSDGTELLINFSLYNSIDSDVHHYNLVNNNWELQEIYQFESFGPSFMVSDDFSTIVNYYGVTLNFNGTEWVNSGGSAFVGGGIGGNGASYDINMDGTVLIYGNEMINNQTGVVRVFQKTDNNWIQMGGDLTGPEPTYLSRFGTEIDISDDGMTISATSRISNSGVVLFSVYSFNQDQWELKGSRIQEDITSNNYYPQYTLYNNGDSFCGITNRTLLNQTSIISILSSSTFNTDWVELSSGYSAFSSASAYNVGNLNNGCFVKSGTVVYFSQIGLGNDELQLIVRFVN